MLPNKDPAESVIVEFDFTGELTTPSIAVVSVVTESGHDPGPESILQGSPQIIGAKVYQRLNGGVQDVDYHLRCEATQGDDVRVLADTLPVRIA
jgi:hypothetical protein